jgi:transcriptional regulator with XRE-family HTH domain
MRFSEKLEQLQRKHLLNSQEELAAFLGVNQTTVSRWLTKSKPHRSTAAEIAEKFEIPVECLLDDTKELPFNIAPASDRDYASNTTLRETGGSVEKPAVQNRTGAKIPVMLKRIGVMEKELKAMRETLEDMLE